MTGCKMHDAMSWEELIQIDNCFYLFIKIVNQEIKNNITIILKEKVKQKEKINLRIVLFF